MPHYLVLQPNGKFAIWSTITDGFLYLDLNREQAILQEIVDNHDSYPGGDAQLRADLERELRNIAESGVAWAWAYDWNECIKLLEAHWEIERLETIDALGLPRRIKQPISQAKRERYWRREGA